METKNQNIVAPKLSKESGGLFPTAVSEEELQEAREKAQKRIFGTSLVFDHINGKKTGQEAKALPDVLQAQINQQYNKGLGFLSQAEGENAVISFSKAIILDSQQVDLYVKRAEAFLLLCDFQSAALNLRKAFSLNSLKTEYLALLTFILYLQGQCLFDQECYLDALDSFTRASELQPWNSTYQLRCIACLDALGQHRDCLRLVNMQLEEKQNADLYVLRARLYDHYGQVGLCFQDVQAALSLEPEHTEAHVLKMKLMAQAGEAKVLAVCRALEGKQQQALRKINLAIENQPFDAQYYIIRGAIYRRLQKFTTAVDDYLMAMELSRDKETRTKAQTQLLLTYNDFAVNCYTKGFYKEGVLLLNKALQGQKKEAGLYINRGDCFFQLGEMSFALADYQQALDLHPYDQNVWSRIGVVHNELGLKQLQKRRYQQAESHFSRAIEKQPHLPQYYLHRARVRRWLQDYKGAQDDTATAARLDSDSDSDSDFDKAVPVAKSIFPGKSKSKSKSETPSSEVAKLANVILKAGPSCSSLTDSSQHERAWHKQKMPLLQNFLCQNPHQKQQEPSFNVQETEDNKNEQCSHYLFRHCMSDCELYDKTPPKQRKLKQMNL